MIESEMNKELISEIVNCYQNNWYDEASNKARKLLENCNNHANSLLYSIDLAHLLCLAGKFEEARPMLKALVEEVESSCNPDLWSLEKLYLAYANCLFNCNDFFRFYYYVNKYLKIAETLNPEAYSTIKQLLD